MISDHNDWYSGLSAEEVGDFKKVLALRSTKRVADRLLIIIQRLLKEAELNKKPDYTSAGWPYAAADANGFARGLNRLIALLS